MTASLTQLLRDSDQDHWPTLREALRTERMFDPNSLDIVSIGDFDSDLTAELVLRTLSGERVSYRFFAGDYLSAEETRTEILWRERCPVCGYSAAGFTFHSPDLCPCCLMELGVADDWLGWSYPDMRRRWAEDGMRWRGETPPPVGWDPVDQLRRAGWEHYIPQR